MVTGEDSLSRIGRLMVVIDAREKGKVSRQRWRRNSSIVGGHAVAVRRRGAGHVGGHALPASSASIDLKLSRSTACYEKRCWR